MTVVVLDQMRTVTVVQSSPSSLITVAQTGMQGPQGNPTTVNGHTGASITLTAADVSAVPTSAVGAANGVASLDSGGLVPYAQLPVTTIAGSFMDLSTNQTVATGIKTFSVSPTVPTPTTGTQAANKSYVDGVAQGLAVKGSCAEATTAALPSNTYSNGASGVGATLTGVATGVLTVDGQTVALNDRVLVQNEVTSANNGIYLCTVAGAVGVAYVLTRSTDMNTASEFPGAFVFVEKGTTNVGAGFTVASAGPFTVGTTAVVWTQFSGAGEITAGTGLSKSGNTISLTTPVSPTLGGTGQSSLVLGDTLYASAANTFAKLSGNTIATRKFLRQLGTGSVSAAPVWDTLLEADVPSAIVGRTDWINVKSPTYGATGNGSTDDTTAIAAAITAAAGGGVVYFPAGTYKISTPLAPTNGVRLTGSGAYSSTIVSTASSLLTLGPSIHLDRIEIDHLALTVTGFDLITGAVTGANIARSTIHDCILTQNSSGNYIWNAVSAALMEECVFERNAENVYGATRTVPAWGLSGGAINQNIWQNLVCWNQGADATQYYFDIYAVTSGTQNIGNTWRNIVFENPLGGMIRVRSTTRNLIENCLGWDFSTSIAQSLVSLGSYAGNTVQPARDNTIINCGRTSTGSTFGAGAYDIQMDSTCIQTTIINPPPSAQINMGGSIGCEILGSAVSMSVSGYTPTAVAAAGAGTSPPAPVITAGSDNRSGTVTWGTGTSPTTGNQVTITFGQTFATTPVVMFSNGNGPTSGLNVNIQSVSTTGFVISTGNAPAASQSNTTYKIAFAVLSG